MTTVTLDAEVHSVAQFMERNVAASRLVSVAEALASLAPILWSGHGRDVIVPLALGAMTSAERKPATAIR
jgi:hypothetical protein